MRASPRFATHENNDIYLQGRLADVRRSTIRAREELRTLDEQIAELRERERVASKLAPQAAPWKHEAPTHRGYKTLRFSYDMALALRML